MLASPRTPTRRRSSGFIRHAGLWNQSSEARARSSDPHLPLRHAVALGLLHGPAELLPVSSSAHVALVPWLARWPYPRLAPELRKTFEVALHAGTAAALLGERAGTEPSPVLVSALALLPVALTGYALEGPIERRLGTPATVAAGLLAGSLALALADLRPGRPRALAGLTPLDGLLLGAAQAAALMPGISRNGATLAVGRARGLRRGDAQVLSRRVGMPVLLGAAALRGARLARAGAPSGTRPALLAGALAAFVSTRAASRRLRPAELQGPLLPYAAYRAVLALAVVRRLRENQS